MLNQYEKNDNFNLPDPPAGLFNKIMIRIREEARLMSARKKIILLSCLSFVSVIALAIVSNSVYKDFSSSGFFTFFSLIFSDTQIILSSWKSFTLALLDALPILSLTILLGVFAIFLSSLKYLAKNIKAVFVFRRLININ